MPQDIKELLKGATKDLLTEETLTQIETVFNESVDKKTTDKVSLQVEAALNQQDEKYTAKLRTLLEQIDGNHSAKLEKVVQALNESHLRKLKAVIGKYQKTVNEESKAFKDNLVGTISNYLELYLEKAVPMEQIQEAVKVKKANKLISEMRKMLGVDLALGQSMIKEGIQDGKTKLDAATKDKDTLVKENADLKARAEKAEATLLLEQKTADLPKEKKAYVVKLLGEKAPDFIKENFDYTLSMYEKDSAKAVEDLKKSAKSVTGNVDRPITEKTEPKNGEVIVEGVTDPELARQLSPYMRELQRF